MNPLIQSKNTTIPPMLIALTLACFALSPQARAQLHPPPDGTYGRGNTAEGGSAGQRIIHWAGSLTFFSLSLDVTYNITVQ